MANKPSSEASSTTKSAVSKEKRLLRLVPSFDNGHSFRRILTLTALELWSYCLKVSTRSEHTSIYEDDRRGERVGSRRNKQAFAYQWYSNRIQYAFRSRLQHSEHLGISVLLSSPQKTPCTRLCHGPGRTA